MLCGRPPADDHSDIRASVTWRKHQSSPTCSQCGGAPCRLTDSAQDGFIQEESAVTVSL